MTHDEAMNAVEGQRFAALTNLASNLKTFLRIACQQPEVDALSHAVKNEPEAITKVFQRALALSAVPAAAGERESEGDAALAIYFWLLSNHRRELAQTAADSVREWRQFFWARKLAADLRLPNEITTGNGRKPAEQSIDAPESVAVAHEKS